MTEGTHMKIMTALTLVLPSASAFACTHDGQTMDARMAGGVGELIDDLATRIKK